MQFNIHKYRCITCLLYSLVLYTLQDSNYLNDMHNLVTFQFTDWQSFILWLIWYITIHYGEVHLSRIGKSIWNIGLWSTWKDFNTKREPNQSIERSSSMHLCLIASITRSTDLYRQLYMLFTRKTFSFFKI